MYVPFCRQLGLCSKIPKGDLLLKVAKAKKVQKNTVNEKCLHINTDTLSWSWLWSFLLEVCMGGKSITGFFFHGKVSFSKAEGGL